MCPIEMPSRRVVVVKCSRQASHVYGLADDLVHAGAEAALDGIVRFKGGHPDHLKGRVAFLGDDRFGGLEPIDIGHVHVHEDEAEV